MEKRKKKYEISVGNFTDKTASGTIEDENWTATREGIYGHWKINSKDVNRSVSCAISRAIEQKIRARVLAIARGELV